MRIVGNKNRTEIELDPVKAYRRGRALDTMLPSVLPRQPRGVTRGTHAYFNRIDDARMLEAARKLNAHEHGRPAAQAAIAVSRRSG